MHVLAAALGVSIILAKSAVAFAAVKCVGAAYLGFLGVRMILDARKQKDTDTAPQDSKPARNPLWQGVATEVLNPKTALFFLSFIPQFVDRAGGTCLPPICSPRNNLCNAQHDRGFDRDRVRRSVGQTNSGVCHLPSPSKDSHRRDHRAGNLSGNQR